MKTKKLIIIAALFVSTVTLSSWRLFGKEVEISGSADSPDQSQCYQTGFQDKYFLGIRVQNDVPVTRQVDCTSGEPLTEWF